MVDPRSGKWAVCRRPNADSPWVVIDAPDGQRRQFQPGDIFLADDADTPGHTTRTIDGATELLWISLPEGDAWETR